MKKFFVVAAVAALAGSAFAGQVQSISYIGQETFATNTNVLGTNMGGLSGLAYDSVNGGYYAISDDRSQSNPARFYSLNINVADGALTPGDVSFTGVTSLLRPDNTVFPALSLDPEGIALDSNGNLWVASEGDVNQNPQVNPFVRRFSAAGAHQLDLPVPSKFLPTPGPVGIRNNLAFETLTLSPSGQSLFTATENALKQDGPAAAVGVASPARILRYDLNTNLPAQEFAYITDPVAVAPVPAGSFATNGLVDMLALDEQNFIAIERSFSNGVGNSIRLYEVSIAGATDISGTDPLAGPYVAATKTLILDLGTLGITLDNIEGLAFGPTLPGGERSLILVSDNNFSSTQFTQFLAFGVTLVPAPGAGVLVLAGGLAAIRRRR
ncbi:MAG: esterase-like activity of phytase family protein [Phycisphaerales bacterium]